MNLFSRRKFMQGAALGVAGTAATGLGWHAPGQAVDQPFRARALRLAAVYDRNGAVIGHLPADTVLTVRAAGGVFASEHGLIAQTDMQPMLTIAPTPLLHASQPTVQAEVIAPSIALSAYAAPDAEIVRKAGHGALLQIVGTLPGGDGEVWYETEDHLWVTAHGLSVWMPRPVRGRYARVLLDKQRGTLRAELDRALTLEAPFVYADKKPDARHIKLSANDQVWVMQGAYDHNDFASNADNGQYGQYVVDIPAGAARLLHALVVSVPQINFMVRG
jgi:hypothetical protein